MAYNVTDNALDADELRANWEVEFEDIEDLDPEAITEEIMQKVHASGALTSKQAADAETRIEEILNMEKESVCFKYPVSGDSVAPNDVHKEELVELFVRNLSCKDTKFIDAMKWAIKESKGMRETIGMAFTPSPYALLLAADGKTKIPELEVPDGRGEHGEVTSQMVSRMGYAILRTEQRNMAALAIKQCAEGYRRANEAIRSAAKTPEQYANTLKELKETFVGGLFLIEEPRGEARDQITSRMMNMKISQLLDEVGMGGVSHILGMKNTVLTELEQIENFPGVAIEEVEREGKLMNLITKDIKDAHKNPMTLNEMLDAKLRSGEVRDVIETSHRITNVERENREAEAVEQVERRGGGLCRRHGLGGYSQSQPAQETAKVKFDFGKNALDANELRREWEPDNEK